MLSATDSFAVLKLVPQQTDNAMVRRAFRRIALDIHPDKACDQHDTACIRAVGAAVVAAAVARDELLDIDAQLQLLQRLPPRQPLWLPICIAIALAVCASSFVFIMRTLRSRQHCRLRALRARASRRGLLNNI